MKIKEVVKTELTKRNPLAILRRRKMRERLINNKPTFICPNCIGGILFHDLGIQFQSPTVNLMMYQEDCAKFLMNMDYYLQQEFIFYQDKEYTCPCAHLGDIRIHFIHFKTEEEAARKWHERANRIDKSNMFAFLMERDDLSYDLIEELGKLNLKGLVIFTAHDYPEFPYCVYLKEYAKDGEVGNILEKSYVDDSRKYERAFDFVRWFNEANGQNYDVSAFIK